MRGAAVLSMAVVATEASPYPGLPRLNLYGNVSVSGLSSGADLAAAFHVANSDIVFASGIFAGQPPNCAVQRFAGEPQTTCAASPSSPGCSGMNATGSCPCIGCDPGMTLLYDHCKTPAWPLGPGWVDPSTLAALSRAAAAAGDVPPLAGVASGRVYLYRGTKDAIYLDGAVNQTAAYFRLLGAAVKFDAAVPSAHAIPTVDPAVPTATCGGHSVPGSPAGLENCGFDGAGAALQVSLRWLWRSSASTDE